MDKLKINDSGFSLNLAFNVALIVLLSASLALHYLKIFPLSREVFMALSFVGLLAVGKSALAALGKRQLTIDLLASVALVFAFLAQEWYSAAFINLMLAFARIFALWTDMRAKHIIERLFKYRPSHVKVQRGREIVQIPTEHVKVGDKVVIEAGERIPVDGTVISGQASVNEATLTGESQAVSKKNGSHVYTSTLNETGSLLVVAEKIGSDSTLAKIISLVEEASRNKAPTERIASSFTQWYICLVLLAAIFLYLVTHNLSFVLAVLLVVCADDIAIAVPLSFTAAIARAATRGILIKGSDVLEKLPRIKIFISDKTGTLTTGRPHIREFKVFSRHRKIMLLELLGAAAANSAHPIDGAILRWLKEQGIRIYAPDEFHEVSGEGVMAKKDEHRIYIGRPQFLEEHKIKISSGLQQEIDQTKNSGFGIVAVAVDGKMAGFLIFEDEVRPFARAVIQKTKNMGVASWVILTGDNEKIAEHVAKQLNIDIYEANIKAEDKLDYIKHLKGKTREDIAMIGDGVNDAAALALTDVGIAMGVIGSDAAIEAADVALMHDNLERIPEMMLLARRTMQIIRQNFFIWGVSNGIGLFLVFAGILHPVGASTYNFITDFFPILNALRMNTYRPKPKEMEGITH